ncbi:hypothetical protein CPB85DRAFT_1556002 [Mucidula mucida]|nr:hypothetical protein CPB85DRAFT_1556002 [Mucidula mucida]
MSYKNPLHPTSVPNSGFSSITSSSSSSRGSSHTPHPHPHLNPKLVRLPIPDSSANSKWKKEVGRPVAQPIPFNWNAQPGQGIQMQELAMRDIDTIAAHMNGGNEPIYVGPGVTRINFHITWPGYSHLTWSRTLDICTKFGMMTRAQLGVAVAGMFMRFLERARYEQCADARWHIGPNGIQLSNIVLLAVWNPIETMWQADIALKL